MWPVCSVWRVRVAQGPLVWGLGAWAGPRGCPSRAHTQDARKTHSEIEKCSKPQTQRHLQGSQGKTPPTKKGQGHHSFERETRIQGSHIKQVLHSRIGRQHRSAHVRILRLRTNSLHQGIHCSNQTYKGKPRPIQATDAHPRPHQRQGRRRRKPRHLSNGQTE